MEQVTDAIVNPTALLIERLFWLGLGGFFWVAIIRGLKERKNKKKTVSPNQLNKLEKKAIHKNRNSN
tara:strand:+ start:175 stop:375 length:201 start_codon:yes stop_codon:yes gene_type:complete